MPIFVFQSGKDKQRLAFTSDEAGRCLPACLAPWCRTSGGPIPPAVGLAESVHAAIEATGYVLVPIGRYSESFK